MLLSDAMKLADEIKGSVQLETPRGIFSAFHGWPKGTIDLQINGNFIDTKKWSVKSYHAIKNNKNWQVYKNGCLVVEAEVKDEEV